MLGNLKTDNCGRTPYAGQVMDFTPDYSTYLYQEGYKPLLINCGTVIRL